jgi:hypothetical protein
MAASVIEDGAKRHQRKSVGNLKTAPERRSARAPGAEHLCVLAVRVVNIARRRKAAMGDET